MLCELFKQLPQKYKQLYQDPIISSCLFRSLNEFQQQIIFRFITQSGQMRIKQLEKLINPHYQESKINLKSTMDKFQQLSLIHYINQQKLYKINKSFSSSLENFIYSPYLVKPCDVILTNRQIQKINITQPLLHLLYQPSLAQLLKFCNLSFIDLNNKQLGYLTKSNFNYIRLSNSQRIGILIRGYLKYKNNVNILKDILYLSLLKPGKVYQINTKNQSILPELQKLKLVVRVREKFFSISKHLYHFAFENKIIEDSTNLKCRVIIETNFKVYVSVKSKDSKSYTILKSIMKELVQLEHQEYDFQQLIVGTITQSKMNGLFDRNITSHQFFTFFRQYMDSTLSLQKDLGKWKKLKFLGFQGPNEEEEIPNNVKQEVRLWEKIKKQSFQYQTEIEIQENSD